MFVHQIFLIKKIIFLKLIYKTYFSYKRGRVSPIKIDKKSLGQYPLALACPGVTPHRPT